MRIALLSLLFCLPAGDVLAGPVALAIGAISAAAPTLFSLQTVGTLALSFGLSYVAGKLLEKPSDIPRRAEPVGGVKIDVTVDANVPRSIGFGTFATAGSLVFADTYGNREGVANSDFIGFRALADHPCEGLVSVFIGGKSEAYAANPANVEAGALEGMRVTDYNNKLFFKFYDGTQTAADQLARNKLVANPIWTADHIGHGICYVRDHAIYHPTTLTQPPEWKFVVKGIKLYDPRKDTTAGGSGSHRFNSVLTHEWTENPMVIAYNILRGIYVRDGSGTRQHFYGLVRANADHLPFDAWVAAMNACDQAMTGSDSTKRYRAGGEISVDTEPHEVIKELLKCCGGRLVELGGVYTPYVDAPGIAVAEFTDSDILDREDVFIPVMPLEQRVNHIVVRWTNPTNYSEKEAPAIENADYEEEDGRRLPAELTVPMVQYWKQAQRLGKQLIKRGRRARKWKVSLPPRYFAVEAGQITSCNSTRNGFVNKKWEVDAISYHGNFCVTHTKTEIDPTDYDFEEADLADDPDDHTPTRKPPDARVRPSDLSTAVLNQITTGLNNSINELRASLDLLSALHAELEAGVNLDIARIDQALINTKNQITAAYHAAIIAATGPNSAIAVSLQSLHAQTADIRSKITTRFTVGATPAGAIAAYELILTAQQAVAGMTIIARQIAGRGRIGQIAFNADDVLFGQKGNNSTFKAPFVVSGNKLYLDGTLLAESIRAAEGAFGSITSPFANLGRVTAGELFLESPQGDRLWISSKTHKVGRTSVRGPFILMSEDV